MDPASPKISKPGVFRYMAPELLNPLQFKLLVRNPSKESDVYSLAMTAFEVHLSHTLHMVTPDIITLSGPHRDPPVRAKWEWHHHLSGCDW